MGPAGAPGLGVTASMPAADGVSTRGFTAYDWGLVATVAAMWGSSFLLIKIGVHDLSPAAVAWLRLVFGAATLTCFPAARRSVRRAEWLPIGLLGVVWMAVPFVLFPYAEESIPSALAGMINGAAPLFTAVIAAGWYRQLPGRTALVGLVVGFVGVLAVNLPALGTGTASGVGIVMVLVATLCYGVAFNLAGPLEARSGPLPVIWRAVLVAAVATTPSGLVGLAGSDPDLPSLLAMAALGVTSTGLAFAAFTTLISRVGATRGSVTVYLVPVVAIILGVLAYGEPVAALSLVGVGLVLLGAYLTGRRTRPAEPETPPGLVPEAGRQDPTW